MKIDEKIKEKIDALSSLIVGHLLEYGTVFINIPIEEEFSQYDVVFSYNFKNLGAHQRGILANDLIIGVIGFRTFGFKTCIPDTDPMYYAEKLGIHSNFLSFLFNDIRKKLHEKS